MISFGANYSANDTEVNKDGTEVNNENKNIEKIENKSFIKNVDLIVSTVIMIIGIIIIMFSLWFWSNKKSNLKMFLIFIGFLSIIIPNIINLISFADNNSDSNLFLKQLLQNKDSINNKNLKEKEEYIRLNTELTAKLKDIESKYLKEKEGYFRSLGQSLIRLDGSVSETRILKHIFDIYVTEILNKYRLTLKRLEGQGMATSKEIRYLNELKTSFDITMDPILYQGNKVSFNKALIDQYFVKSIENSDVNAQFTRQYIYLKLKNSIDNAKKSNK